jgi:hypothetical protein
MGETRDCVHCYHLNCFYRAAFPVTKQEPSEAIADAYRNGYRNGERAAVIREASRPPVPKPPTHICQNCRFFVAGAVFGGFCHRHAPAFIGEGIAKPEAWPFLSGEDFCGEWEAK